MNWDWIVAVLILLFFALIIWAKIEHKQIKEVLFDIRDFISDLKGGDEVEYLYE